ncbi:MAG: 30S ribosomal protein S6e [Candidatus Aenigmatarchaeota archaeon]
MKITVGAEDGTTHQIEIDEPSQLIGKKIGETFDGGIVDLPGYTLEITGGSDKQGFPMRRSIEGSERKSMLLGEGSGIQAEEGVRKRKSIRGNTVSTETEQLNTKVVESGSKSIEEILEEDEAEEE